MPYMEMTVDHDAVSLLPIQELHRIVLDVSISHYSDVPVDRLREYTIFSIIPAYRTPNTALMVKIYYRSEEYNEKNGVSTQDFCSSVGSAISGVLREAGFPRKLIVRAFAAGSNEQNNTLGTILSEDGSLIS